jgi:hypothetical protein
MSGLRLRTSFATLANVSVQPKPVSSAVTAMTSLSKSKVLPENIFTTVASSVKTKLLFTKFDFRLTKDFFRLSVDSRFNDELPRSTSKFTPFEELSGISSTRPEILCVSEFKPIYSSNGLGFTPAGEFLDAQVKLMNLRHEALAKLINDLKKDPQLAEQLDQIEGDFLAHVRNLKSRADFLVTLQKYIERVSKLLDLRDSGSTVNAANTLSAYFGSVFSNINSATATLPPYTYADLLSQHGFNKNNVVGFSSTKVFLQSLYEARKILRAGSDELVGTDPSLASRDSDSVTINKRAYRDPHVEVGRINMPTFAAINARGIHESDTRLTTVLQELETDFRSLDKAFSGVSSDEVAYTLKLSTLAREAAYSHALTNSSTVALLLEYGYPVSSDLGNQQLFDAVYGQLGNRITDNRTGANANAVASAASRVDGDKAVLTYEVDYLEDDQGSVFTPGASYYVASTLKPTESNAFSIERPAELVTRLNGVVDRYINFVGRFNLLPRVANIAVAQLASVDYAFSPVTMANTLYSIFVDDSTGYVRSDAQLNPIVDLMSEAATNAALRANLTMFFSAVTNASGDGLADATAARALAGQDLRQEAQNRAADAENQNVRVGSTVDKLVKNCVLHYKQITGDSSNATKIENALRNYNEQGPLSRAIAFVKVCNDVHKTVLNNGYTRYSRMSDVCMVSLTTQVVLDTARRYAYNRVRVNNAVNINKNFSAASVIAKTLGSRVNAGALSVNKTATLGKRRIGAGAYSAPQQTLAVGVSYYISKLPLKQAVVARLEREQALTIRTVLAPLHAMHTVRDSLKEYVLYLQRSENVKVLNDILAVVGDRKLIELLADKGQVRLVYDTIETVLQRVSLTADNAGTTDLTDVVSLTRTGAADDDLKVFDDSFVTSKTANVIKAAFANSKFSLERASNMRVIAFGLPHGFTARLHNKFKTSAFAEQARSKRKQNDVVVADVYKIDVRYPDIVFKPIPKVVELSRFVSRDERTYLPVQVGASLETILDAVPTRDYSDFETIEAGHGLNALAASEYDFMSATDKNAMVRNTVLSYLHELYFRITTGLPLSERELYVQDPDEQDRPAPFVTRAILQNTINQVFKLPSPPSQSNTFTLNYASLSPSKVLSYASLTRAQKTSGGTGDTKVSKAFTSTAVKSVTSIHYLGKRKAKAQATADIGAQASKKKTVYIDREVAGKYMMSPKLFERVFFVDVDPDDFEIDREETFKSEVGRSTFAQLQQAKEIEVESETLGRQTRDSYYLKDHRLEKQMTFEKYFVVVRAYTPLTTRTR